MFRMAAPQPGPPLTKRRFRRAIVQVPSDFSRVPKGAVMMSKCRTSALAGLLATAWPLLGPVSLHAQESQARPAIDRVITRAQLNRTECTCRMHGENLPVGSEVCMRNSLFRCQMDQNVTTWRPLSKPCPQS